MNEIRKRGSKVTWSACLWLCAWLLPPMIEKMSMCPSKPAADSTAGFLGHHWMSKHHWLLVGSSYSTCNVGRVHQYWKIHTVFLSINRSFFYLCCVGIPAKDPAVFPTAKEQLRICQTPRNGENAPVDEQVYIYVLKLPTDSRIRVAILQHCWCWFTVCDSLKSWEER